MIDKEADNISDKISDFLYNQIPTIITSSFNSLWNKQHEFFVNIFSKIKLIKKSRSFVIQQIYFY